MDETVEQPTKILLFCLGFNKPKQLISSLRVHDLLPIFQSFSSLRKIMIFSKTTILKAFIEFDNIDSAEMAQNLLHESIVDNFGRARLYYSDREKITCSGLFLDFWDSKRDESVSPLSPTRISLEKPFENTTASTSSRNNARLASSGSLNVCSPLEMESLSPTRWTASDNKVFLKRFSMNSLCSPSHVSLDNDTRSQEGFLNLKKVNVPISKVLLISNLDNFFNDSQELFNLFSCFGNLNKVLFMKNLQKALVEFESVEGSQFCLDSINRRQIDVSSMRVSFSKYQKIDPKKNNKSENSLQFNDMLLVTQNINRYPNKAVNPPIPSTSFVISAEPLEPMYKVDVCLIMKETVSSLGIATLSEKVSYKEGKNARIVFTASNSHGALLAITRLHGRNVKGCLFDVAFDQTDSC